MCAPRQQLPDRRPSPVLLPVLLLAILLSLPAAQAKEDSASTAGLINPGWGNAARVCGKPRIGNDSRKLVARGARNAFATGFYRIQKLPQDTSPVYLDARVTEQAGVQAVIREAPTNAARRWLLTQVGADLYQISTCVDGVAQCLLPAPAQATDGTRAVTLGTCDFEGLGTQAWWMHGLVSGPAAGGYRIGNDGLGRLTCLNATQSRSRKRFPELSSCNHDQRAVSWRIDKYPFPAM